MSYGIEEIKFESYEMSKPKNGVSFLECVQKVINSMAPRIDIVVAVIFVKHGDKYIFYLPLIQGTSKEKDALVLFIQEKILGGVEEVILVNEAWSVTVDRDTPLKGTASQHPDRKEIFSLVYVTKETEELWVADIIRPKGAKRTLADWEKLEATAPLEGRFSQFFQRAKASSN